MKTITSIALLALTSSVSAVPVRPLAFHWNEDPSSVPDPIYKKPYLTSTQARYIRDDLDDTVTEDKAINSDFFIPYNRDSTEPTAVQL